MSQRKIPPVMTVDEFIVWDDGRGGKYELVDGIVRAMSPACATHGIIQANLARLVANHLDAPGSKCRVVTEPAIETRIRARHNMRIADLAVSCAPVASGQIALPEPILLVEIMSPGNKNDTWDNVWAYAAIPSVREILIVQSTRIEASLLRRMADGSWPPDPDTLGEEAVLALESIGYSGTLRSAYAKTYLVP